MAAGGEIGQPSPRKKMRAAENLPPVVLLRVLLDYNPVTGVLRWKTGPHRGRKAGYADEDGRRRIQISPYGKILAARAAWAISYGEWPKGIVDHIDRQPWNDRLNNLRDTTDAVNRINVGLRKNNTSGVKGVTWAKERDAWRAQIRASGKDLHLGYFSSIEAAAEARRKAEKKYWRGLI